jgi:tetratricopeptide (TPR) repeat protein
MLVQTLALALAVTAAFAVATAQQPQRTGPRYPNQFAHDFESGRAPSDAEVAEAERDAAAAPGEFRVVRRLGKGYFFQYFGGGRADAAPKAKATLERALALKADDGETFAYLGSLEALVARRTKDPAARKAAFDRALALLDRAQSLAPDHLAVLAIAGASFLWFPESYDLTPRAAAAMERIRAAMGPMFSRMAHHGQQRVLLTQGQAYARMGRSEEARACFDQGLAVNPTSVEGELIRAELGTLAAGSARPRE